MKFVIKERRKFNYIILLVLILLQAVAIMHILQIKAYIYSGPQFSLRGLIMGH